MNNHQSENPTQQPKTQISVPTAGTSIPRKEIPATLYDYFALLPGLIVALTPLILGLKTKGVQSKERSKKEE